MTQRGLFDPSDPHVHPDAVPRLAGQNAAILERLRAGPATNRELAGMALNYRARISDLRALGHEILCVDQDHKSGLAFYRLVGETK